MLANLIKEELVQLGVRAENFEEAIRKAAEPLEKQGMVTQNYIDKIIETTQTTGPYFVLAKHVALPHASYKEGGLKKAIGITVLKEPVASGKTENDPVKYLFTLSATDSVSHLEALSNLVQLLTDEDFFNLLDNSESPKEVVGYIESKNFE